MTYLIDDAPRRAWPSFAWLFKKRRIPRSRLDHIPRELNNHLARDIGLSAHDLAILRHEWPSQSHRPGI